jgi:uncharacterized repeat protein (TIGR03803 family)
MNPIREGWTTNTSRRAGAAITMLALALLVTPCVQGRPFKVLYTFTGSPDGSASYANLLFYGGTLYGTTYSGGASNCGTIFQFDLNTRQETVLHSFAGYPSDGCGPWAGLIRDSAGNLYGTTNGGGASNHGTVFRLDPSGNAAVLYSFTGLADGGGPEGGLVLDSAGAFYGTTCCDGEFFGGTVFELDSDGNFATLHSFAKLGMNDGDSPAGSLLLQDGYLYGVTESGGSSPECVGCGTVFQVNVTTGQESVLHSFTGADGYSPEDGLVSDSMGNLYGTAGFGGTGPDNGTVFKFRIKTGQFTVLHYFAGSDGSSPIGGLVRDLEGNLYGTTYGGGQSGDGTAFELHRSGKLTTLHQFSGTTAIGPRGLVSDFYGNLYGTAGSPLVDGSVFVIEP